MSGEQLERLKVESTGRSRLAIAPKALDTGPIVKHSITLW
jgi:hypothetical protein